jgi:hypothetical protein
MAEELAEDRVVPPKSIGEEEPITREDQDELEGEEEQRNLVLFTPEQLEVLVKMNRLDFGELVAAFKTGTAKGERFQLAKPGNFDGARDRKVVDAWLVEMDDIYMLPRWDGIAPWSLPDALPSHGVKPT